MDPLWCIKYIVIILLSLLSFKTSPSKGGTCLAIKSSLFLWHDATESMVEHSSKLQPTINLHAQVTTFIFSCSCTEILSWRDDGSGKPYAVVEPYRIYAFTRDLNWGCWIQSVAVTTRLPLLVVNYNKSMHIKICSCEQILIFQE